MCEPVTMTAIGTALGASAQTAMMTGMMATTMATTAVAGGIAAKSAYDQGQVQKQIGHNNQIMAEYAAQAAEKRGEIDAIAVRRKGDQILGAQRSAQAASGLDLGVGTTADLQEQTSFFNQQDMATTRTNARNDAWSSRAQGANARAQGDAAARQGNLAAVGTLIGTAGQVADKWYAYNKKA